MILLLILALLQPTPPPPPVVTWAQGRAVVSWSGGTLVRADGLRPLSAWTPLCQASPCEPDVGPGDALAVVGDGGDSAVVLVGPAPVMLPWVGR